MKEIFKRDKNTLADTNFNIRKFYEGIDLNEYADEYVIEEIITDLNCAIFNAVADLLDRETCISLATFCEPYKLLVLSLKRSSETYDMEEVFKYLNDASNDIYEEFEKKENPVRDLCLVIGTNSEYPENYSSITRISILTAIMKFLGANLIFD